MTVGRWLCYGVLCLSLTGCSGGIARVETDRNVVALTFDDGPNPPYTEDLLNVLKQNHIQATFFVVGEQVRKHPGRER